VSTARQVPGLLCSGTLLARQTVRNTGEVVVAFKIKINGTLHSVDVDGDTPLLCRRRRSGALDALESARSRVSRKQLDLGMALAEKILEREATVSEDRA
jgi:hypothetical protein